MLDSEGYCLFPGIFTSAEMARLATELPTVESAGTRSLLDHELVRQVAGDERLRKLTGPGFFAVRALLFDKTIDSNWGLRWHQDLSIAVTERREASGFEAWTTKAGIVHALAPVKLLERMVSLRIHLDDCGADAGPLRVVPRTHLLGRLDSDSSGVSADLARTCAASCGDVLAFKPLLLHSSGSSTSRSHRRVLQLEYACDELPDGLKWRWRV